MSLLLALVGGGGTVVDITVIGIPSGEAFGDPSVLDVFNLSPTGISSASVFGTASVEFHRNLSPSGIPSGEAFGSNTVSVSYSVVVSGIPSGEAFGTTGFSNFNIVSPLGIPSGEAFGIDTVDDVFNVAVSGIPSGEAFGDGNVSFFSSLSPSGIPSGEAFGTPTLGFIGTVVPTGVPSAGAFGTPAFSSPTTVYDIAPTGIPSEEEFGQILFTSDAPVPVNPTVGGGGGAGMYFRPAKHEPKRYPNQIIVEGIPDESGMGIPTVSFGVKLKPAPVVKTPPVLEEVKEPEPVIVDVAPPGAISEEAHGSPVCGFHYDAGTVHQMADDTGMGTPSVKSIDEEQARQIRMRNNAIVMAVMAAA